MRKKKKGKSTQGKINREHFAGLFDVKAAIVIRKRKEKPLYEDFSFVHLRIVIVVCHEKSSAKNLKKQGKRELSLYKI